MREEPVGEAPGDVTPLLAVYGTLRRGYRNRPLLEGRSSIVSMGTLPGRLVHVDTPLRRYPYPGYLPPTPGSQLPGISSSCESVVVEVVRVDDPELWPALDALERYLPDNPSGSEYVRILTSASTPAATPLTCWTYRYNADATGYGDVPAGDWARLHPPDLPAAGPPDVTGP